jgi:hypothetical protein
MLGQLALRMPPVLDTDAGDLRARVRAASRPVVPLHQSSRMGVSRGQPVRGPVRRVRFWHTWCAGTPARSAAMRMQAAAANVACCQKSPVCHEASSSRRSGSAPRAALPPPALRTAACASPGRATRTRAGTARVSLPGPRGSPGWPRTSPARRRPAGGRPRPGRCCCADAGGQLARDLEDGGIAGQPVKQDPGGGNRVFGMLAAWWSAYPRP